MLPVHKECRCKCGYSCNMKCDLPLDDCIRLHFKRDCDHDFTGAMVISEDGRSGSVVCKSCGVSALDHDCKVGP